MSNEHSWEALYQSSSLENLPWYSKKLDHDLEKELNERNLRKGRFLDLGTGPGTQAAELARRGFHVTATDISATALKKAHSHTGITSGITFLHDDILHSKLKEESFDFIFDRGCFHVLNPENRKHYIATVYNLLAPEGILFIKCFSKKEAMREGPHRFSTEEIKDLFSKDFIVESVKETSFEGTLPEHPKALFCVLKKV